MSSVIFRNSDGTRTMYMYGLPVKYTAADGTVRDKSTNLVSVPTASVLLSNQPAIEAIAQMSASQQEVLQAELGILDAERAADTLHMLSTALTAREKALSDIAYTTLDNDVYAKNNVKTALSPLEIQGGGAVFLFCVPTKIIKLNSHCTNAGI